MKYLQYLFLIILALPLAAQQNMPVQDTPAGTSLNGLANLPIEKIGSDDLIGLSVYGEPELTRTVRVESDGTLRLPMLSEPIHASGLYPDELGNAISKALVSDHVLVSPIVTVSVVEYRSRPITVVGAVKNPLTFQAAGSVTLLDAISRAGGLTSDAGSEILVSSRPDASQSGSAPLVRRIPVQALMQGIDPSLNLTLTEGEEIRVPDAGRVFVLGDVKKPGAFLLTDGPESSVLKAVALSEGLDNFAGHTAYIYRTEGGHGDRNQIPVELKKIMEHKAPDVPLMANDILYIPNATGTRASLKVLETAVIAGSALGAALVYAYH